MDHSRDVAWSASTGTFVWDAAKHQSARWKNQRSQKVSIRRRAWATEAWGRSTEYVKDMRSRRFSKAVVSVPVARTAINPSPASRPAWSIPGIVFDGIDDKGKFSLLDHRARNRPRLVSDDRRLERTPQCLHGRRLQHLHRHRGIGGLLRAVASTDRSATRSIPRRTHTAVSHPRHDPQAYSTTRMHRRML